MRSALPSLLLVGTCLVGCGPPPMITLEVRVFLETERIELRAYVREENGHCCVDGVRGYDIEALTPAGELVSLEEHFEELDGTYLAVSSGIQDEYVFYVDGDVYRLASPQRYNATLTLGADPRIDWDPPTGDGEQTRLSFYNDLWSNGYATSPDHVLLRFGPGEYHLVVHRDRRQLVDDDKYTPSGVVSFQREFDVVLE